MNKLVLSLFALLTCTLSHAQDYHFDFVIKKEMSEDYYRMSVSDDLSVWQLVGSKRASIPTGKGDDDMTPKAKERGDKEQSEAGIVYKDFKNNLMSSCLSNFVFENYYIKEDLKAQDWKLQEGSTKILGMDCQMATCDYKGRAYTAYFTTQIALSHGPWKFEGLPGMILKVVTTEFSDHSHQEKLVIECTKIYKAPMDKAQRNHFQKFLSHKFVTYEAFVKDAKIKVKKHIEMIKLYMTDPEDTKIRKGQATYMSRGELEVFYPAFQSTGVNMF